MPFAALRGYYDLIRERERVPEPRRGRTDEEDAELSALMASVKKGDMLRVTYYDRDAYVTLDGLVASVDTVYRRLTVIKTAIPFDDIYSIEPLGRQ